MKTKTIPRIVTFEDNGVAKISDYTDNTKSNKEIITMMHNSSYRQNLVKRLRELTNSKSLDEMNDNSLGYALESLITGKKVFSTITRIEFHDRELRNFGVKV